MQKQDEEIPVYQYCYKYVYQTLFSIFAKPVIVWDSVNM